MRRRHPTGNRSSKRSATEGCDRSLYSQELTRPFALSGVPCECVVIKSKAIVVSSRPHGVIAAKIADISLLCGLFAEVAELADTPSDAIALAILYKLMILQLLPFASVTSSEAPKDGQ